MTVAKLKVRPPTLPGNDFFSDARHSIMCDDGTALLSYDVVTSSGFVYYIANKAWAITSPVDFTTWALLVRATGITVSDSQDARRWFRACSRNPAGGNVVDFPPRAVH